jgi:hypothetical protein
MVGWNHYRWDKGNDLAWLIQGWVHLMNGRGRGWCDGSLPLAFSYLLELNGVKKHLITLSAKI